jgi:hypothetical protein
MNNIYNSSIKTSYLFGLPFGLILMLMVFFTFTSNDKSVSDFIIDNMGYSVLALIVGFIISIWFAGKVAANSILKENNLIVSSIKFSLIVNGIMWSFFALAQIITGIGLTVLLRVPIIGFIICLPFSILSIGMIVSYKVKKQLKQDFPSNFGNN